MKEYVRNTNNMKIILIILACLTYLASDLSADPNTMLSPKIAPPTMAPSEDVLPFFGSVRVNRMILKNGLRILVVEDHSSPTFAYQTWFKVGSRNEVSGKTGLAHLFEHMMFKETKTMKEGEFDRLLEGVGAEGENAFTSRDYTAYIQELPSAQLELIMKAESDRMTNIIVDEKAFKTEREVVQNERRYRNENNPDGIMEQELFRLGFKKHPYSWPVIGYQQDLEQMTADDAFDFYRKHYSPNQATIVVVGDVQTQRVRELAEKYYGDLIPHPSQPVQNTLEPSRKKAASKEMKLNIQVEKVLLGFPSPAFNHVDFPVFSMIKVLLAEGKKNRLHDALVETGIASSIGVYDLEDKDPSLFIIMANLQKGRRATQAEAVILKELKKLSDQPISPAELERAKNKNRFSFYKNLESNYEKAQFIGSYESLGDDFQSGLQLQRKIGDVTEADIHRVLRKYFTPNLRTTIRGLKK
jgi:zinc protease